MTDLQLETALSEAADLLLQIDPAQRGGWIMFLLEALDEGPHYSPDADFGVTLVQIAHACLARVTLGSW